jgi:CDP-2,3-bis-(O-geranylgeranyl)-sn-glycerol synthase
MFDLLLGVLARAVWFILPAYVANASAVIVHGREPLDQGLTFLDGRPLLGRGKTMIGFAAGVFFGTLTGVVQAGASYYLLLGSFPYYLVTLALVLSVGAMAGDSLGSFVKRRFDLKPGQATPFLDQWDFVLGAFIVVLLFQPWSVFPGLAEILAIMVVTPFLHIVTNYAAFRLKFKAVPW